jgi:paired amphipathic helix protein Sin3a
LEKPKRIGPPGYIAAPGMLDTYLLITLVEFNLYSEVNFFHEVRRRLNNNALFHEFLKCINLFSQDIISKAELVNLIKDLLGKQTDLFSSFKHFIGFTEPDSAPGNEP